MRTLVIFLLIITSLSSLAFGTWKLSTHISHKVSLTLDVSSELIKNGPIHWESKVSPSGLYKGDSFTYDYDDRYNYFRILVTSLKNGSKREVYRGDFRTLGWEWLTGDQIIIKWNCGTGCLVSKIIESTEEVSLADYVGNGKMNEKNGWEAKFFKSF